MADKFEEVTGKLALVALHNIPVVNIITEIVESFLPETADERLKAAIEADLGDRVDVLELTVKAIGEKLAAMNLTLDELGPLRTAKLAEEFLKSSTETKSEVKQRALVVAAARQFDPRPGPQHARDYWFQRLRGLSDIEVAFLLRVAELQRGTRFQINIAGFIVLEEHKEAEPGDPRYRVARTISIPESEVVAYAAVAETLSTAGPRQLLIRPPDDRASFFLSDAGYQIARIATME